MLPLPLSVIILLAAAGVFAYPFLIYPLLLPLIAPRRRPCDDTPAADLPCAAMVVCALNEERVIGDKIENSLALEYPAGKLRFVFVSDGSTDQTAAIVRSYADRGVELIEREQRRGKVANLNDVVPRVEEEVVILSDANVMYDKRAVLHLVRCLGNPEIGCASGKVILLDTTEEFRAAEEDYYSVEWKLQDLGSRIYSMAGADGAMYAFRRALFRRAPDDTLIEDFVLPVAIVRQGRRVVFQPDAIGWEQGPGSLAEEFRRKVRIAAGAAQALTRGNGWPVGAPLRFWFVFVSHKLLRWVSPFAATVALAAAVTGSAHWMARTFLAGCAGLVLLAGIRAITGWRHVVVNTPFYFLFGQMALFVGFIKGLTGRQSVLWAKANR
jgi:cellulose synthase/poly-beta-1,6-N-acetylglucosamine synthase-like glycosyltransferase